MFTGLVADLGVLEELRRSEGGATLRISAGLTGELHDGDSIAVNGVCLTATSVRDHSFQADAMNETLTRSTLGGLQSGARVNLELPLRASDRLGGHLVQGHVDAVGEVAAVTDEGIARRLEIAAPADVLRYVVEKGSIAVNGVSLTVVGVGDRSFTASLIPETLERTNLGAVEAGAAVNLEVDVMAKYVERLVRR
ncbi:MAG TPA: riboflavin synthase [Solirubrobacteraceae bacterium]